MLGKIDWADIRLDAGASTDRSWPFSATHQDLQPAAAKRLEAASRRNSAKMSATDP